MAAENALATVTAYLTKTHGGKVTDMLHSDAHFEAARHFKYMEQKRQGESYNQTILHGYEQGIVYNSLGDSFSTGTPIARESTRATVSAISSVVPSDISWGAISRLKGDKMGYIKGLSDFWETNITSHARNMEIDTWFGQAPLAVTTDVGATSTVCTITLNTQETPVTFLWGSKNMLIDVFATTGSAAPENVTAAMPVTDFAYDSVNAVFVITATCDATDTAALDAIAATPAYVYKAGTKTGASSFIVPLGFQAMASATSLYGVTLAGNSWYAPYNISCGNANLTGELIRKGQAIAFGKGSKGRLALFCSLDTAVDLATEQVAKQAFDSSYKKSGFTEGAESLEYHGITAFGSENRGYGKVEVIPTAYMKQGRAFLIPVDSGFRIGSSDLIDKCPGTTELNVEKLEGNAGIRLRSWNDSVIFHEKPGCIVQFTGITNG